MKKIPLASLALMVMLIPGAAAATTSSQQAQSSSTSLCSTTGLFAVTGTFTLCVSNSVVHIHQTEIITVTLANPAGSGGNLFFYQAQLNIANNGSPVFSASQSCPTQFGCPVASGQSLTITFSWIVTRPSGVDNVVGTLTWDFGCRIFGCLVVQPPPAITTVNVTVK